MTRDEPIVFRWSEGRASMGYLGRLRWRVVTRRTLEADDVLTAVEVIFGAMFEGVPGGHEARMRSPFSIEAPTTRWTFASEAVFHNGWRCAADRVDFTVGDHALLLPFVAETVAREADEAWARGISLERPPPLAARFSFAHFAATTDRSRLCGELELALNERLASHPSPATAFARAMKELREAGHDLWSWDPGESWGYGYMTGRPGAGLQVTRNADDDDDDDDGVVANTVSVAFASVDE